MAPRFKKVVAVRDSVEDLNKIVNILDDLLTTIG